jgi:Ca2+/Na+ antiporter
VYYNTGSNPVFVIFLFDKYLMQVSVNYLMQFVPYQRLTITTDLSKEEVSSRMKEYVRPNPPEGLLRNSKYIFSGRFVGNKFQFRLNTHYRNSWTPEITGIITENNNKIELSVTLKSNSFVIAFTTLFIIFGLTMLINDIIDFKETGDFNWITLLFIIFPYGLSVFGFNLDADKSIDGLIKITKGEIK